MSDEQHKKVVSEMKAYVDEAFHKNINGNLTELSEIIKSMYAANSLQVKNNVTLGEKLDSHLSDFQEYVERDEAWKKENEPYLKGLSNLTGSAKIVVWLAVAVSSIAGAWLAIKGLLNK